MALEIWLAFGLKGRIKAKKIRPSKSAFSGLSSGINFMSVAPLEAELSISKAK